MSLWSQIAHIVPLRKSFSFFLVLGLGFCLTGVWAVFSHAQVENSMGLVQKIFYFHVPSAWAGYMGFLWVSILSVGYLITRKQWWDQFAYAAAEVGVLFTFLVLVTGPIWAKPAWGVWWSWDPRLTLTLILFMIYLGYLILRRSIPDQERAARFCAVLGIVGVLDIPIIHFSVKWWRGIHPQSVVMNTESGLGSGLTGEMLSALILMMAGWTCIFWLLFILRYRIRVLEDISIQKLFDSDERGV